MAAASKRRNPTAPSKGDLREGRLLAAGRQLVAEGRFDAASVADLAAAADVSRPAFYFYFASKQALLIRLVGTALENVAASLSGALERTPDPPVERLRTAIARGADTWWEHRAVMSSAMELAATVPAIYDRMIVTFAPVNALCVRLLSEHGTVPEARSEEAASRLVLTLALMNERALSHAMRSAQARDDLRATEEQLLHVWARAMGLETT